MQLMNWKNILLIASCVLGAAVAALYCQISLTSWVTFVSYNDPSATPDQATMELKEYITQLPKGQTGHGISFMGLPIEEEYDWGSMKSKEYHGLPGGRWTFFALGGLAGWLLFWVVYRSMNYRAPVIAQVE